MIVEEKEDKDIIKLKEKEVLLILKTIKYKLLYLYL